MELLTEKDKKKQLVITYIAFVMNGMLALSIGALLPFIREARGLEYAFSGFLVSLHSVGNLLSSFLAGALAVRIGKKKSILIFNSFYAISFLIILLSGNSVCLIIAFLMTGLARGASSNFCNAVVNNLAPGKAAIINGLHAMFSVGAFIFPIILMFITANGDANCVYACAVMVIAGIICWLLYFIIPIKEEKTQKQDKGSNYGFFKEPILYEFINSGFDDFGEFLRSLQPQ